MVKQPEDPESWSVQVWAESPPPLCCCTMAKRLRHLGPQRDFLKTATLQTVRCSHTPPACDGRNSRSRFSPQILRSIDSDSADGFPSHQQEAMQMGLDSGKGKIIEYSIQKVCHSSLLCS
jgi:hypothetical protein